MPQKKKGTRKSQYQIMQETGEPKMSAIEWDSTPGIKPKYQTAKELSDIIEAYLKEREEAEKPVTMSGLCIALDIDRSTLCNYANSKEYKNIDPKERQGMVQAIKRARMHCADYAEQNLYKPGRATGSIFSLKNNFGWKDEQTHTVNLKALFEKVDVIDLEKAETLIEEAQVIEEAQNKEGYLDGNSY